MRQAEGDLSHRISGCLRDRGRKRGEWLQGTSTTDSSSTGGASVSRRVKGSEATPVGGVYY